MFELSCPYKLGLKKVRIYGGPYRDRPKGTFGINMAKELDAYASDVLVPTRDFSVPEEEDLLYGLKQGLLALAVGRKVYVGCMGGIGRTGLYMAAMAKVLGEKDPVGYVRRHYKSHAVETPEQKRFIEELDVSSLRIAAFQAKVARTLLFWV